MNIFTYHIAVFNDFEFIILMIKFDANILKKYHIFCKGNYYFLIIQVIFILFYTL